MEGIFKVGVFDDEEKLVSSLESLVKKGISVHEVFTPYPMHRVIRILKRKSMLPTAALIYGLVGAAGGAGGWAGVYLRADYDAGHQAPGRPRVYPRFPGDGRHHSG